MRRIYNARTVETTSQPGAEPVTLEDAKNYLRVDTSDDDSQINTLITAAREAAESYTRRSFITQGLRLHLDGFSGQYRGTFLDNVTGSVQIAQNMLNNGADELYLPRGPVQSISSINTYNESNSASEFSSSAYRLDASRERVILNDDQTWPTDLRDKDAVEVNYVAGYGAAGAVPATVKQAILEHVRMLYDGKADCDELPKTCKSLLNSVKKWDRLR